MLLTKLIRFLTAPAAIAAATTAYAVDEDGYLRHTDVEFAFPGPIEHPALQHKGDTNRIRVMLIGPGALMDEALAAVEDMADNMPWSVVGLPEIICVNFDDFEIVTGETVNFYGLRSAWIDIPDEMIPPGCDGRPMRREGYYFATFCARMAFNDRYWLDPFDAGKKFDFNGGRSQRLTTDYIVWYHGGDDGGALGRPFWTYYDTILPLGHPDASDLLCAQLREWIVETGCPDVYDGFTESQNRHPNRDQYINAIDEPWLYTGANCLDGLRHSGAGLNDNDATHALHVAETPAIVIGDMNMDGFVNTADLALLLNDMGYSNPVCDLNNDGVVDTSDLAILIGEMN